ncbi:hypothetical protein CEE87_11665, partial [Lactobacillus crispatus]
MFCGAQAGAIAFGKEFSDGVNYKWVEELFDYERELGVSAQTVWGLKKTVFNGIDFGAIVATTSTTRTGSILLSTACLNNACATANGNIVLGSSSLTAILPDESSGTLPTSTANSKTSVNGANNAPYFQTVLQPTITIQASGSVD